jgi:hypothetical protein
MKMPLHNNIRTNKRIRKYHCFQKDKGLLSTRYENCSKCNGIGEVYYINSSNSILNHVTCHGEKIYTDQLCKACDDNSMKQCKTCYGMGCY